MTQTITLTRSKESIRNSQLHANYNVNDNDNDAIDNDLVDAETLAGRNSSSKSSTSKKQQPLSSTFMTLRLQPQAQPQAQQHEQAEADAVTSRTTTSTVTPTTSTTQTPVDRNDGDHDKASASSTSSTSSRGDNTVNGTDNKNSGNKPVYFTSETNNPDTGVYDEIEIEDMEYDDERKVYTYPCPCGDKFVISKKELSDGEDIARCPSCSLMIRVIFDDDMFQEDDDEDLDDDDDDADDADGDD